MLDSQLFSLLGIGFLHPPAGLTWGNCLSHAMSVLYSPEGIYTLPPFRATQPLHPTFSKFCSCCLYQIIPNAITVSHQRTCLSGSYTLFNSLPKAWLILGSEWVNEWDNEWMLAFYKMSLMIVPFWQFENNHMRSAIWCALHWYYFLRQIDLRKVSTGLVNHTNLDMTLTYFVAVWLWTSYLPFLCISFFICYLIM